MVPLKQLVPLVFQDPSGAPLAGGKVTLRLSTDTSAAQITGPQVAAGRVVETTLNSNGQGGVTVWPNDTLFPPGTVYFMTAYSSTGQPVWSGEISVATAPPESDLLEEIGDPFLLESGDGFFLMES